MLHSYPWYIKDWLLSEARLTMTLSQRGLYRDLLDHFFEQGSLPANEAALFRMAACDLREFRSAWPVVRTKFEERDGRLYNGKAEEVLASKVARQVKNAMAGSSGGLARAKNADSKMQANAKQVLSECLANVKQTSSNGSSKTQASDVAHGRARSPSPTTSNPPTPLLLESNATADTVREIFERILARHKSNYRHTMKIQMIQQCWVDAIGKRPDDPVAMAMLIDKAHSSACSTDNWQGKYREALDKWLDRSGYMDQYPDPVDENDGYIDGRQLLKDQEALHAQGD